VEEEEALFRDLQSKAVGFREIIFKEIRSVV